MDSEVLLEDKFVQLGTVSRTVKLQLRANNLLLCPLEEERASCKILPDWEVLRIELSDVLGVYATENRILDVETKYSSFPSFLQIFWYPTSSTNKNGRQWKKYERRHLVFSSPQDEDGTPKNSSRLNLWVKHIRYCKEGLPRVSIDKVYKFISPAQKPILFILNPKSGQGRGEATFWRTVAPVFIEAGRNFELRLTCRANHAREFMRDENLAKWAAVVAVSGDGLLHEMINGLFERDDWRTASKVPIGIIPAGSGNGLFRSLSYYKNEEVVGSGLEQASLRIAKGSVLPMDLTFVETEHSSFYSFLSIGYALLSDVDIESEFLRWMGELRFYVLACARILSTRYYRAKLSYLPADEEPEQPTNNQSMQYSRIRQDTSSSEGYHSYQEDTWRRERMSKSVSESIKEDSSSSSLNMEYESDDETSTVPKKQYNRIDSLEDNNTCKLHVPELSTPRLSEPVPSNWKTIEDDFVILSASYQSHLAKDLIVSPDCRPDDGLIWLFLLRRGNFPEGKVPMSVLINFFLACDTGDHVYHEKSEMLAVKAFRLEPHDTSVGHLTIDGELIKTGPIQATVLNNAANIIA